MPLIEIIVEVDEQLADQEPLEVAEELLQGGETTYRLSEPIAARWMKAS